MVAIFVFYIGVILKVIFCFDWTRWTQLTHALIIYERQGSIKLGSCLK
jgi:hypothetical protein